MPTETQHMEETAEGAGDLTRSFARLFQGRRDAYGLRHGESVKEPVTLDVFRRHLAGKQPIGIYPVLDSGTCWFAAVDFDRLTGKLTQEESDRLAIHDAAMFIERLANLGLNRAYPELSKSKGTHAWVFFDEPVSCADVRRVFTAALEEAPAITHYELFPKQDRVTESQPLGNYINLPYFGEGNTSGRNMIFDLFTRKPVPLATFMERVERFSAEELAEVVAQLPDPIKTRSFAAHGAPAGMHARTAWYPCATPLLSIGLAEHEGRNDLGFLNAKRLYMSPIGESSRPMFDAWNALNTPPLRDHEADRIWEQGAKYTSMGCERVRAWAGGRAEEIRAACVQSCAIHPSKGVTEYHRLRKVETEPPIYYLSVSGEDVRLTTAELWSHPLLRKAALEQVDRFPPGMKVPQWEDTLNSLLAEVERIKVPEDASEAGMIWHVVREFLSTRQTEEEEHFGVRPVVREGEVLTNGSMLRRVLKQQGFAIEARTLWSIAEAHGASQKNLRIHNSQKWVWAIPETELAS